MSLDDKSRNLAQELDTMKRRYHELLSESETMRAKVICLESERNDAHKELKRSKDVLASQRRELSGAQEYMHIRRELENQVENHKRQIVELQGDLDRLRDLLKDTENDMQKYQNQYQDSMDLIEKLTANNVDLKIKVSSFSSELDTLKTAGETAKTQLQEQISRRELAEHELLQFRMQLKAESVARMSETADLRRQLEEKDLELQRLRNEAEDSQNEKRLLSRTYNASLKDLKRQLSAATKAHNGTENGKGDGDSVDLMSVKSRASSSSSLDTSPVLLHGSFSNHALSAADETRHSPQTGDIDRSVLIDKIVNLQRELARKDEKCDFLEDHIALLTAELRKRQK